MKRTATVLSLLLAWSALAVAENFRAQIVGVLTIENEQGASIDLGYIDSAVIQLNLDPRFVRGIEFELKAPPAALRQRGNLAMALYRLPRSFSATGVADLSVERLTIEALPPKLQSVWVLPLRQNHGFATSPYATLIAPSTIPAPPFLFRLLPVNKGLSAEVEAMRFTLVARPVLADEGALRTKVRYPAQLRDRPYTLRLDGNPIKTGEEIIVASGEHHLAVESVDYRSESRQIVVERGRSLDLTIDLQDSTPLVTIEAPENAIVRFDDQPVEDPRKPFLAEPGQHEVRFLVGDYTLVKMVTLRRGQSYRIALIVDISVTESD